MFYSIFFHLLFAFFFFVFAYHAVARIKDRKQNQQLLIPLVSKTKLHLPRDRSFIIRHFRTLEMILSRRWQKKTKILCQNLSLLEISDLKALYALCDGTQDTETFSFLDGTGKISYEDFIEKKEYSKRISLSFHKTSAHPHWHIILGENL